MSTSTLLAPIKVRITVDMLKAAARNRAGVVVLDEEDGTVYALSGGLTTGQARDARYCVLIPCEAARAYLAEADTAAIAAQNATADIRDQITRGHL